MDHKALIEVLQRLSNTYPADDKLTPVEVIRWANNAKYLIENALEYAVPPKS